jgi:hypothetical protein
MKNPGDIVTIIRIAATNLQGYLILTTTDNKTVMLRDMLSREEKRQLEGALKKNNVNMVCVQSFGPKNISLVSLKNYEKFLINFFYKNNGKGKNIPIWIERWKMAARKFNQIQCKQAYSGISNPRPHTTWRFAVYEQQWQMPVYYKVYNEALPNNWIDRFIPTQQYYFGFFRPSSYRTNKNFPNIQKATIKNVSNVFDIKEVTLILHGFIAPEILHYKFWRHVISGSPGLNKLSDIRRKNVQFKSEERDLWAKLLTNKIPDKAIFLSRGCKENYNGTMCYGCSVSHFKSIHNEIVNSLSEYCRKAVSTFLKAPTKHMITGVYGHDQEICKIQLNCIDEKIITGKKYYPSLSLEGVCYNWTSKRPEIHLVCRTFFIRNSRKICGIDNLNDKLLNSPNAIKWVVKL